MADSGKLSNRDREELLRLFVSMERVRRFEERVRTAFVEGLVHGTTHLCIGQEAVCSGVVGALRTDDYLTYTYRGHGVCIARGMSMRAAFAEIFGRVTGVAGGLGGSMHLTDPDLNLIGAAGIVGGGLPLAVGAALLMLALDLLLQPRRSATLAGAALGLAYLARPELLVASPVLAALAGRAWWRTTLAFVACAWPWWLHNLGAAGSPFFNLSSYLAIGYWDGRPDLTVLRDFALAPAAWPHALAAALPSLPAKWLGLFPHAVKRALLVPTGATGWLALVGVAVALHARETRRAAIAVFVIGLIPVAVMTTTVYDWRYLTPFLPIWAIAAALGARTLFDALPRSLPDWTRAPAIWLSALALLVLPAVVPAVREGEREARTLERRLAFERESIAELGAGVAARREILFSDRPDFAAWTVDRSVVWVTREEFGWLPAVGAPNPHGLPERGAATATWFHVEKQDSVRGDSVSGRR